MSAWFNWALEPARFEAAAKVVAFLLALGLAWTLAEVIRYVRSLRREKERAVELMARPVNTAAPREIVAPVSHGERQSAPRGDRGTVRTIVGQTVRIAGTVSLVILIAVAALVPFLGALLEYQDQPQRADYIVTFAGDRNLMQKTADLYQQGYANRILLGRSRDVADTAGKAGTTGARPDGESRDAATVPPDEPGVPASVTTTFGSDRDDLHEAAIAVHKLAEDRRAKVILVVPRAQSWRAKLIFEDEMPKVRFFVVSQEEGKIGIPWWTDEPSTVTTMVETAKLFHHWVDSIRTRAPDVKPQAPHQGGLHAVPEPQVVVGR